MRDIELRLLFEPTQAELRAEVSGRIYIYEGLRSSDIGWAIDEEFERVESMMFIRTEKTTQTGEFVTDPVTKMSVVSGVRALTPPSK